MEQISNVQFRAEKEYKNSREKFFLLLREIVSNSIHAVLIRQDKDEKFVPSIHFTVLMDDTTCRIELMDNGEGFTSENSYYFEHLDKKNPEKEKYNFHPLGQGRLAILFFSDSAEYETVYKDDNGVLKKRVVPYLDTSEGLFSLGLFDEENPNDSDTYTNLRISINKQNTYNRAKTFFNKYSDVDSLKHWFIETFFPFIISNDQLSIDIRFNGGQKLINKDSIETEIETIPFELIFENKKSSFKLWLIKKEGNLHGEQPVICFARNLRAELSNGEICYSIDNNDGYLFYLTSDLFDDYVDNRGEKIELPINVIFEINNRINEILDEKFKSVIATNQKETKRNLESFKKQFPSLEPFIQEVCISSGKNVINKDEIIRSALDEKGKIEKKFWTYIDKEVEDGEGESFVDSIDCQKLLNSSLHVYVKHRERVLNQLHSLIRKFDSEGNDKPELESTVHELFLKRGTTLNSSSNINQLHNLWILDDKFTIFSNDFQARSTKSGQALSDIYIWADDPEKTKQILILELKSTTHAHNAGDREEGMIAQVKRYAQDFYKNPKKVLNWDINTKSVQYIGIILARKSDINKELTSNNVSGDFEPIPFLKDSYYKDEKFANSDDPKVKVPIRIELYSFEDIYQLATSRNEVFFKLLKNEFCIDAQDE